VVNTSAGGTNAIGTVWQPGLVFTDGIHPDSAGHIAIAQTVVPASLYGPP
jgi:lysophospholipase L1-like esterase